MEEGRQKLALTRKERMSKRSSRALLSPGQKTQRTGRGVQPEYDYFKHWATSEDAYSGNGGLTVHDILAKVRAHHRE